MRYFDTSAFSPLFLDDIHSRSVAAFLRSGTACIHISDLTMIEFASVVSRAVRMRTATAAEARDLLPWVDEWVVSEATRSEISVMDIRVADAHVRRFDLGLRAPDAIHIAICQRLGLGLATCDDTQAAAARTLGVDVVNLSARFVR